MLLAVTKVAQKPRQCNRGNATSKKLDDHELLFYFAERPAHVHDHALFQFEVDGLQHLGITLLLEFQHPR